MRTADFDFKLPPELIAQFPAEQRDQSRLLVVERQSRQIGHHQFHDLLTLLRPGDLLVLNDSRVMPARLRGQKSGSGGQIELLLLEEIGLNNWWAMLRPGKRVRKGTRILLHDALGNATNAAAIVQEKNAEGHCRLEFEGVANILHELTCLGEIPLPPYISRPANRTTDVDRYQTVFAQPPGSVAAPTAGLHFTRNLLTELNQRGIDTCVVTLHVGLGTFAPVKTDRLEDHIMHEERFSLATESIHKIQAAKAMGRRVIAVGTTSVRVLESNARIFQGNAGNPQNVTGKTRIFIHPPYNFQVIDALITNFHLPQSTLLMLVSAFASPGRSEGHDLILKAYSEAIRERYRFFSYGDAMFIQ